MTALNSLRFEFERLRPSCGFDTQFKLASWTVAFEALKKDPNLSTMSPRDQRTLLLLDLQSRYFWVDSLVYAQMSDRDTPDPTIWDTFTHDFETMLGIAKQIIDLYGKENNKSGGGPLFYVHNGIVPVLRGIVLKCRDPAVRQLAMSMLMANTLQEGLWSNTLQASICLRIMDIENCSRSPTCNDIPAMSRIRKVKVQSTPQGYVLDYESDCGCFSERVYECA